MSYSRIDNDPASAAAGGTSMTTSTQLTISNNISLLPFTDDNGGAELTLHSWGEPSSLKYSALTALKLNEKLGFAIAATSGAGPEYDITSESGAVSGKFKSSDMKIGAGISYRFLDNFAVGLTVCYLNETLSKDNKYSAVAADLLFSGSFSNGILASAGLKSLGTKVTAADGTAFALPSSAYAGALWSKAVGQNGTMKLTADADLYFSDGISAGIGAEYGIQKLAFLRAGYRYGGNSVVPSSASAGFGLSFKGVTLDAAFVACLNKIKSNNILFGIGYRF